MALNPIRFGQRLLITPREGASGSFHDRVDAWKKKEVNTLGQGGYKFFFVPGKTDAYCVLTNDINGRKDASEYFHAEDQVITMVDRKHTQDSPAKEQLLNQQLGKLKKRFAKRPNIFQRIWDWILRRKPIKFEIIEV